jgi:hypothetical protein
MKICAGCKQNRSLNDFTKAKLGKDGLRSKCKDCRAIEAVKYNNTRKNEISDRGKRYREREKERISAQRAIHTEANKEKLAIYEKAWRLANPGKVNAKTARRRAAKLKASPKWLTKEHWKEIEAFYIEAAQLTKETGIPHEVDHREPLQGRDICGLHVPWNLKVMTRPENRKKSRKRLL